MIAISYSYLHRQEATQKYYAIVQDPPERMQRSCIILLNLSALEPFHEIGKQDFKTVELRRDEGKYAMLDKLFDVGS